MAQMCPWFCYFWTGLAPKRVGLGGSRREEVSAREERREEGHSNGSLPLLQGAMDEHASRISAKEIVYKRNIVGREPRDKNR